MWNYIFYDNDNFTYHKKFKVNIGEIKKMLKNVDKEGTEWKRPFAQANDAT